MMDTSKAERLIRVRNQVEKWAEGLCAVECWGHRLKIGVFTANQELFLGLDT